MIGTGYIGSERFVETTNAILKNCGVTVTRYPGELRVSSSRGERHLFIKLGSEHDLVEQIKAAVAELRVDPEPTTFRRKDMLVEASPP